MTSSSHAGTNSTVGTPDMRQYELKDGGLKSRRESLEEIATRTRERVATFYGYGDNPIFRAALYDKIAESIRINGLEVVRLIEKLLSACGQAEHPDRFFIACFIREAKTRRWWPGS